VLCCGLESDFLAGTACLEHCASYLSPVRVKYSDSQLLMRSSSELVVYSAFFRKMVVLNPRIMDTILSCECVQTARI
jgi:hypothetical protein